MQQIHHNTPDEVRVYLAAALDLVADLDPPGDLRAPLFDRAVNLLSSKNVVIEPSDTSPIRLPLMASRLPERHSH